MREGKWPRLRRRLVRRRFAQSLPTGIGQRTVGERVERERIARAREVTDAGGEGDVADVRDLGPPADHRLDSACDVGLRKDPADLALPGSSELVACSHSSLEPVDCDESLGLLEDIVDGSAVGRNLCEHHRHVRAALPRPPDSVPKALLELATVEEPRLRITRRQLGQASLASVARGRVPNGDELTFRRRVVDDPPRHENSNAIAAATAEGELRDRPPGRRPAPRATPRARGRAPGGQNGNGSASPEKLVAIEPEQVAKTPVDRDDPTVADEHEPVGNRREQRASLVPLTVERRRVRRRLAAPPNQSTKTPRERKRESSGGRKPRPGRGGAACRTDTTAAAPAVTRRRAGERPPSSVWTASLMRRPRARCARTCATPCPRARSATCP